jgi:phospholipid transport system substrate-binding protein
VVLVAMIVTFGFPRTTPSYAQAGDATSIRKMLEARDAEIKQLLEVSALGDEQRDQLKDVVNGVIDFEAMGKSALGEHWDGLSAEQRSEFVNVFSDIVRSQSVADLEVYRSKVAYKDIGIDGTTARVETVTTYKNTDTPVVYTMHLVGENWLVTDIILNDVSTADGYARSFQGLVRKRGFDTLMEKLRARRDKES